MDQVHFGCPFDGGTVAPQPGLMATQAQRWAGSCPVASLLPGSCRTLSLGKVLTAPLATDWGRWDTTLWVQIL